MGCVRGVTGTRTKEDGKKVAEVAWELDLAEQTLHNWVTKFNKEQEAGFV
ncbi:transposase, partial [Halalkalibacter alkalisediminis]